MRGDGDEDDGDEDQGEGVSVRAGDPALRSSVSDDRKKQIISKQS